MSKGQFDQQEQDVENQQNAGGDIFNVYVQTGLATVGSNSSGDIAQVLQQVKVVLQQGRVDSFAPNVPAEQEPFRPSMQSFQAQQQDPYQQGNQWLGHLQNVAMANGNPWVPQHTQGFYGVDLTGVWASFMNPAQQTYIRQYGPYLNIIAGIGGFQTSYAEGVVNPLNWNVSFIGRFFNGLPSEASCQLFADWSLRGQQLGFDPFGNRIPMPIHLQKVA
jgi:hypothetical protein